ncbi:DUF4845 domain-containing protein [Crenothrix polyspora]|jgi:Domain of unknown function (DUF4845)|uniref:Transmembrane protein n=1 Tax=Crenothrix polyspora TaxID=360316 RepID=A0A1R4H784_9GAMM|nr:DUF4845 domain-containing protein [Crenothrix polyspora]SJM92094.1 conserved hypothetical protein [Crenothrix polyspora]
MTLLPSRQRGLTLISTILLLGGIAVFVLVLLKIVPVYLDHNKVANALSALEKTAAVESKSEYEIRDSLAKRFNLNYVYDVTQDDIKITKHGGYLKVAIQYEVVKKLVGNLSILAEFNDVIEVGQK